MIYQANSLRLHLYQNQINNALIFSSFLPSRDLALNHTWNPHQGAVGAFANLTAVSPSKNMLFYFAKLSLHDLSTLLCFYQLHTQLDVSFEMIMNGLRVFTWTLGSCWQNWTMHLEITPTASSTMRRRRLNILKTSVNDSWKQHV